MAYNSQEVRHVMNLFAVCDSRAPSAGLTPSSLLKSPYRLKNELRSRTKEHKATVILNCVHKIQIKGYRCKSKIVLENSYLWDLFNYCIKRMHIILVKKTSKVWAASYSGPRTAASLKQLFRLQGWSCSVDRNRAICNLERFWFVDRCKIKSIVVNICTSNPGRIAKAEFPWRFPLRWPSSAPDFL